MIKNLKRIAASSSTGIATLATFSSPVFAADPTFTPFKIPDGFFTDVGALINSALNLVLVIAALLVFMYLIWGGIEWITSGGDKGKTESARNKITAAVIGLIVLAASYAILLLVLGFLNIDLQDLINTI